MAIAITALPTLGCTSAAPTQVDAVIEPVRAAAPDLPALCTDAQRRLDIKEDEATLHLVLFTSEWCDACDRMLDNLARRGPDLQRRGISVRQVVAHTDGDCMRAARVGRRAPFAYAAATPRVEDRWAIRSTPTLWVIDAHRHTRLYVEGVLTVDDLLNRLER